MLVDNFTAGIIGGGMALLGALGDRPGRRAASPTAAGDGVDWLIDNHLLPLASILVEPAKVLFLNNAINHGVLGPLGVAEAAEHGQVDPVHDRVEPRPRPRPAAGVPVLRPARAAPHRARPR